METTATEIEPTGAFRFAATARSHGWVALAPNAWDERRRAVRRVHRLASGRVLRLAVTGADDGRRVRAVAAHQGELSVEEIRQLREDVTRMFRLREDLSGFHRRCRERGGRWRAAADGLGRLLRSPTVWEDLVKTLCTTNIRWSGTQRMVRRLVGEFGPPPGGEGTRRGQGTREGGPARAFPDPGAVAAASPGELAEHVGLGYRGPYVHELARRIARGGLDPERWRDGDVPTAELERELKTVTGVGDYAAATMLMLLGRYDRLPVDSVFREFVGERYFDGAAPSDDAARSVYEDWGEWKSLAYWFDMRSATVGTASG